MIAGGAQAINKDTGAIGILGGIAIGASGLLLLFDSLKKDK